MRSCIVCQTDEHSKPYCHIDHQDYVRCAQCGLIYIEELLKTEALYKAYSGDFLKSLRRKLVSPFRRFNQYRNFDEAMQRARQIMSFADEHLPNKSEKIEYLDIGCNRGYLLGVAHELGWNPHGVELVPELMAPFLNTYPQYKRQVFTERFEDTRKQYLRDNMFDIVTGIDVVEHFEDVLEDLSGIYKILKPGGIVVFQTPDAGCEEALQKKCAWGALKPLEHLHLFTSEGFQQVVAKIGFSDYQTFAEFEHADGNFVALMRK